MTDPDYGGTVTPSYLEATAVVLSHLESRMRELLHLEVGQSVLDVGCGSGIDTIELARVVGPTGRVVGVDIDAEMIKTAATGAHDAGVADWTDFSVADATSLAYESETFDVVRSERMLQHAVDPAAVVAEMCRVTRRNGRVVLIDTDWQSLSIDSDLVDIERRLVRFKAEKLTRNGGSGRQLFRHAVQSGLVDLVVEPVALFADFNLFRLVAMWDDLIAAAVRDGVVTEGEVAQIEDELSSRADRGVSHGTLTMTIVAGRKP